MCGPNLQAGERERETQRETADTVRDTEIDTGSDSDEVEGETKQKGENQQYKSQLHNLAGCQLRD